MKDCKSIHLIDAIAMCAKGELLCKAVDYRGEAKDANFIACILIELIEMLGS